MVIDDILGTISRGVLLENGYAASIYITESDSDSRGRDFLAQMVRRDVAYT